jgi:prepilin-type N-terminal cleavage/methylation domain-containing protein
LRGCGARMRAIAQKAFLLRGANRLKGCRGGFSLIELLLGLTILSIGLLAIATMFSTGYTDLSVGGTTTMGVAAARQMIEDMRLLPFQCLAGLDQFDTSAIGSLPAAPAAGDPDFAGKTAARNLARKWHYALSGEGGGWTYTATEKQMWNILASGFASTAAAATSAQSSLIFGGVGTIAVASEGGSASLMRVTVTVTFPGRLGTTPKSVQLATLISRL